MFGDTSTAEDANPPDEETDASQWHGTVGYWVLAVALAGAAGLVTYHALVWMQGLILHFAFWPVTVGLLAGLLLGVYTLLHVPLLVGSRRLNRWRDDRPGANFWVGAGSLLAVTGVGITIALSAVGLGFDAGPVAGSLVVHPATTALTSAPAVLAALLYVNEAFTSEPDPGPDLDPEYVESQRVRIAPEPATSQETTAPDDSTTSPDAGSESPGAADSNPSPQDGVAADGPTAGPREDFEFDWQHETGVSLADVGGMFDLKSALRRDVIRPLTTDREKAEALDIAAPNLLFYGPPGTGKTYLARALATELGLPFVQLSGADIQTKWINESPQKVKTLFSEAQQLASAEGGAVIFLDELDAVLRERTGATGHGEDQKVVNEFLNQLQDTDEHGVLFIGATNRRDDLDKAVTRSGRIDREFEIGLPDAKARKGILEAQLQDLSHQLSEQEFEVAAWETDGLSAADLAGLVEDAKRIAAFERDDDVLVLADLKEAYQRIYA